MNIGVVSLELQLNGDYFLLLDDYINFMFWGNEIDLGSIKAYRLDFDVLQDVVCEISEDVKIS